MKMSYKIDKLQKLTEGRGGKECITSLQCLGDCKIIYVILMLVTHVIYNPSSTDHRSLFHQPKKT